MNNEPALPPLPIVDGAFLVDNSQLESFSRCPRLWEYAYLRRRVLISNTAGRNFGSAIHLALALRYQLCGNNAVTEEANRAINDVITKYFAENPPPEHDHRTASFALACMDAYNAKYQNEEFHILARANEAGVTEPVVESSFCLDIGEVNGIRIKYMGRTDLWLRNNDGDWVSDHKTAFQFGKSFEAEMAMDHGQLGYAWSYREITGKKPNGYITNAIRVRRPTSTSRYDDSAPFTDDDFKRIPNYVFDNQLDEFKQTVLARVAMIFHCHKMNHFPMVSGKVNCVGKFGACDFYNLCSSPAQMRLTEMGLLGTSYQNNEWTPLNKTNKEST